MRASGAGQVFFPAMTSFLTPLVCLESPLRRFDPRWKLAALTISLVVTACLQTPVTAAIALIGAVILAGLARLPIPAFFERLKIVLPALVLFTIFLPFVVPDPEPVLIGPIRLSSPGLRLALLFILKALAIFTLTLVLTAASSLSETLQGAASLRVPGTLIHIAMLTYRYLFLFANELGRLRLALRVRGYRNRPTRPISVVDGVSYESDGCGRFCLDCWRICGSLGVGDIGIGLTSLVRDFVLPSNYRCWPGARRSRVQNGATHPRSTCEIYDYLHLLSVLTGTMKVVKIQASLSAVLICASHLPERLPVQ